MTEQAVMILAILDMVVPKTVPEDLEILFSLVKDLFPESDLVEVSLIYEYVFFSLGNFSQDQQACCASFTERIRSSPGSY